MAWRGARLLAKPASAGLHEIMISSERTPPEPGVRAWPAADVDVSVGVDLVEVPRLARLAAHPVGLAGVLTERELRYCRSRPHPAEHLAARFAAKEAVLKALGTGLSQGIRWTDVEILKERGGRPLVVLHGAAEALAGRRRLLRIDVSLSHTAQLATAYAIALWSTHPPD